MKVNFNDPSNKKQIVDIRSQIKNSTDLRKFDDFLAQNDSFDFNDSKQVAAAKGCCGGESCCENITITVGLKTV